MTCEVAVMSKYAIVIAADSAVTTTDNNGLERYSTGGNKIFQLSNEQQVGAMIFGSAMLDGVPSEIIIKPYRATAADTSYATLAKYCAGFFTFVNNAAHLFPTEDLDKNYRQRTVAAARRLITIGIQADGTIGDASKPDQDRRFAWQQWPIVVEIRTMKLFQYLR
ncbi:hypothetical protein HSX11_17905 [Oxalobacteraceae bacterium]|nr:hypothetical protein [Oxalobacteraceae bacterium]